MGERGLGSEVGEVGGLGIVFWEWGLGELG